VAARLYSALVEADRLLEELHHAGKSPSTPASSTPASSTPASDAAEQVDGLPLSKNAAGDEDRHRPAVSARQVPKILLTVGSVCLLAAAIIFLAVSWSRLGVGGRTGVLLGMTAVSAATTVWASRRRLTAALEAFGVVTLGLVTLDLFGAESAGWAGNLDQAETLIAVGAILIVLGILSALGVRRYAGLAFHGGEAFAILGGAAYTTGLVTLPSLPLEQALVLALLGTIVTAQAATAFRLRLAIAGSAAVSLATWIALVWHGTDLGLETPGWHKLWLQGHGWPLMVAAVLPWLPAFAQALPRRVRELLVGIGGIPLLLLLALPTLKAPPNRMLLVGLAVLAASALVVRVIPPPVGSGWTIPTAVALLGGTVLAVDYAGLGVERMGAAAWHPFGATAGGTLPPILLPERVPDPAFNGLLTLALCVAAWAVAGRIWRRAPRELPARGVTAAVAAMSWWGAITLNAPVWSWLVAALVIAAGFTLDALQSRSPMSISALAGFVLAAVVVSLYAPSLNLLAAATGVLLLGLVALREDRPAVRIAFTAACSILVTDAIWAGAWWRVTASAHQGTALFAITLLGLAVVGLAGPAGHSRTPSGWASAWYGAGVGALLSWPVLAVAGAHAAPVDARPAWAAAYLTVMGAAITGVALLWPERRLLVFPGTALLAIASWIRLWDLGVGTPEAYTLPWAALLVAVGTARVIRHGRSSLRDLAPGLILGLAPSLLWVLHSPVTLRALLLGVACLTLVLVGVRARWSAPLLYGAAAGLIEVIRLAAPYAAQALPRWALIGAAGALLVLVGVTWERRLAEARGAWRYLAHLR
jgi:hypothetical protein